MKTPPVQLKQSADSRNAPEGQVPEGKSQAAPAFQLKTSDGNANALQMKQAGPQGSMGQSPVQRAADVRTINAKQANLRGGPPNFTVLKETIPTGTRVEILEEQVLAGKTYVRVKDHDTGAELGWTSKGNTTGDIETQYANSKPSYVYNVGGFDMLVFLPTDGLKKSNPDIFMFFHGRGGDYKTKKTHTPGTNEYDDNPAISGKIPEGVSKMGGIAICPQGHQFKVDKDWGAIGAGTFKSMVDMTLLRLSTDLGLKDKPLSAGNISLAGHSAGGNALGQAALDTGATDVTLQEAGYEFENSWGKLRDWFLTGQAPKTMRVITQGNSKGKSTRTLLRNAETVDGVYTPAGKFKAEEIVKYSKELVKKGELQGPVTVQEFQGEAKEESGGIIMDRGFRVMRSDGSLQGSLRLYHLADKKADHWAAASKTMESSMTAGATDRAADQAAIKK